MGDKLYQILIGNAIDRLRDLPGESVDACITSPPYYALRDYQTATWVGGDPNCDHRSDTMRDGRNEDRPLLAGDPASNGAQLLRYASVPCGKCGAVRQDLQIGLEPTPELYVQRLVELFREVRRVLKPTGVFWLNIGDTYAHSLRQSGADYAGDKQNSNFGSIRDGFKSCPIGYKEGDLLGIPWMVAFALRADGWYLRHAIPWTKANPMPESVESRPGTSHEYIFLLSKTDDYFYDVYATRFPDKGHASGNGFKRPQQLSRGGRGSDKKYQPGSGRNRRTGDWFYDSLRAILHEGEQGLLHDPAGNPIAFCVNVRPFKGAHFATWPQTLVTPMIQAGTSEKGVCSACGKPWVRLVEKERVPTRPGDGSKGSKVTHLKITQQYQNRPDGYQRNADAMCKSTLTGVVGNRDPQRHVTITRTIGWRPGCVCGAPADLGLRPDDMELIQTPTGDACGELDPSLQTGLAGMNRPRNDHEGRRPITRYEQRKYAEQLKNRLNPPFFVHLEQMRAESRELCGDEAWSHYLRTDRSGARPIPPELLEVWIERGWLHRVDVPTWTPPATVPSTVLDPFLGSGTTVLTALQLGRRGIGIELNEKYAAMARERIEAGLGGGPLFGGQQAHEEAHDAAHEVAEEPAGGVVMGSLFADEEL